MARAGEFFARAGALLLGRQTYEGTLSAGDTVAREPADPHAITVAEVVTLYTSDADSRELLERAAKTAALPQAWRDHFQRRLWDADS
jgi:MOSC domain-containing protein YiiM